MRPTHAPRARREAQRHELARGGWLLRCTALLCGLAATAFAPAMPVVVDAGLPKIHQHNAAYDRNAGDGNQNGDFWCVPVAAASALIWLSDHWHQPALVPRDGAGAPRIDDLVKSLAGGGFFNTSDTLGTNHARAVSGVWNYVDRFRGKWEVDVFSNVLTPADKVAGPDYFGHATFQPIWDEFYDPGAAILLIYTNSTGRKHATVLQSLDFDENWAHRHPAVMMNPDTGAYEDIELADVDGRLQFWDVVWNDVYLAISIQPMPAPGTAALLAPSLAVLLLLRRAAAPCTPGVRQSDTPARSRPMRGEHDAMGCKPGAVGAGPDAAGSRAEIRARTAAMRRGADRPPRLDPHGDGR